MCQKNHIRKWRKRNTNAHTHTRMAATTIEWKKKKTNRNEWMKNEWEMKEHNMKNSEANANKHAKKKQINICWEWEKEKKASGAIAEEYIVFFSKRNTTDIGKFNSAHRTRQDIFQRGTEIQSKINRVTYSLRIHAHQRQVNGKIILFVTELGHTHRLVVIILLFFLIEIHWIVFQMCKFNDSGPLAT